MPTPIIKRRVFLIYPGKTVSHRWRNIGSSGEKDNKRVEKKGREKRADKMKRTQTLFNLRTFFIDRDLPYSKPALLRSLMDLVLRSDSLTNALRSLLNCPLLIPDWSAPKDFTMPEKGTSSLRGYS